MMGPISSRVKPMRNMVFKLPMRAVGISGVILFAAYIFNSGTNQDGRVLAIVCLYFFIFGVVLCPAVLIPDLCPFSLVTEKRTDSGSLILKGYLFYAFSLWMVILEAVILLPIVAYDTLADHWRYRLIVCSIVYIPVAGYVSLLLIKGRLIPAKLTIENGEISIESGITRRISIDDISMIGVRDTLTKPEICIESSRESKQGLSAAGFSPFLPMGTTKMANLLSSELDSPIHRLNKGI